MSLSSHSSCRIESILLQVFFSGTIIDLRSNGQNIARSCSRPNASQSFKKLVAEDAVMPQQRHFIIDSAKSETSLHPDAF